MVDQTRYETRGIDRRGGTSYATFMAETEMMTFAQALALRGTGDGSAMGRVSADWGQGRATFGGLIGAIALKHIMGAVDLTARPLRTLCLSFVAPVLPGEVRCHRQLLRAGKALTVVEGRIAQGDTLCCIGYGAFGAARESTVQIAPPPAPALAAAADLEPLPYCEGVMPACWQHFRIRWAAGNFPFSGSEVIPISGYCELVNGAEPLDACALVATLDAWPPPAFAALTELGGASTVSWSIDILANLAAGPYPGPYQYEGKVVSAQAGHVHSDAWLWDAHGRAPARATQLVALYG